MNNFYMEPGGYLWTFRDSIESMGTPWSPGDFIKNIVGMQDHRSIQIAKGFMKSLAKVKSLYPEININEAMTWSEWWRGAEDIQDDPEFWEKAPVQMREEEFNVWIDLLSSKLSAWSRDDAISAKVAYVDSWEINSFDSHDSHMAVLTCEDVDGLPEDPWVIRIIAIFPKKESDIDIIKREMVEAYDPNRSWQEDVFEEGMETIGKPSHLPSLIKGLVTSEFSHLKDAGKDLLKAIARTCRAMEVNPAQVQYYGFQPYGKIVSSGMDTHKKYRIPGFKHTPDGNNPDEHFEYEAASKAFSRITDAEGIEGTYPHTDHWGSEVIRGRVFDIAKMWYQWPYPNKDPGREFVYTYISVWVVNDKRLSVDESIIRDTVREMI